MRSKEKETKEEKKAGKLNGSNILTSMHYTYLCPMPYVPLHLIHIIIYVHII